ncbi:glycosyl transferase group 1 [Desulfofundulus kuznetsovii DSM 6115]|uniref:Glycosyl transferase group 1 n=1 Tax=Desulfofundulus kuznetsovii (strain DSM 6115 / VKM B-1805 / 17) TaxID=760568 RepID=A0AAU8Q303_DESK7|nr:glycosyl transferase group 1 [Desulfofundulus kuznetsovii DSM 6115]
MNGPQAIKVAALTGGKHVPSARFRVRQLIPALSSYGVEMHEFIPAISKYPPELKWLRPFWGTAALVGRFPAVLSTHRYDIVFLQRELISTFLTLEPLTKRPRVLDVDDAIFLHRDGRFAKRLAQLSDLVICGNDFLAEHFSQWNKNVTIIPTAIDTRRFTPRTQKSNTQDKLVIGWTGTSGNFKYLYQIEEALEKVIKTLPNVVFRVIADKEPKFRRMLKERLDFVQWSPETEVKSLQTMTVGIMPLADTEWERGKCSYKMLQYMACGIPVVVSPVGMNAQVLSLGKVGFAAKSLDEWVDALLTMLSAGDSEREKMGNTGRRVVEKHFSIDVIAPTLARVLRLVS